MKVSRELYELSEKILNSFDPVRLKSKEMEKIKQQEDHLQARSEEQKVEKDPIKKYEKWNILD